MKTIAQRLSELNWSKAFTQKQPTALVSLPYEVKINLPTRQTGDSATLRKWLQWTVDHPEIKGWIKCPTMKNPDVKTQSANLHNIVKRSVFNVEIRQYKSVMWIRNKV
jgi:hypothetical protein